MPGKFLCFHLGDQSQNEQTPESLIEEETGRQQIPVTSNVGETQSVTGQSPQVRESEAGSGRDETSEGDVTEHASRTVARLESHSALPVQFPVVAG